MFLVGNPKGVSFRKEYDIYVPGQMAMIPKPEFFRTKNWGTPLLEVMSPTLSSKTILPVETFDFNFRKSLKVASKHSLKDKYWYIGISLDS